MKLHTIIATTLFTVLAVGCDQAPEARGDAAAHEDPERGQLGKADALHGFCGAVDGEDAAACGGPAPVGNCWCDEACLEIGDCCIDSFDACGVGQPQPAVSQCFSDAHCEDGQFCAAGVCINVEPEPATCGDGTPLHPFCDMKPGCNDGEIATVIKGCFQCVDAVTCE